MSVLAAEWGTGQVFWSMIWFFLFFIWIYLLIMVFADIFRSHDLSGIVKAIWIIFVIFLPYLGVFVYLIARGAQDARARDGVSAGSGTGDASVRAERGAGGESRRRAREAR